jgi:hypothetical protein
MLSPQLLKGEVAAQLLVPAELESVPFGLGNASPEPILKKLNQNLILARRVTSSTTGIFSALLPYWRVGMTRKHSDSDRSDDESSVDYESGVLKLLLLFLEL